MIILTSVLLRMREITGTKDIIINMVDVDGAGGEHWTYCASANRPNLIMQTHWTTATRTSSTTPVPTRPRPARSIDSTDLFSQLIIHYHMYAV